MPFDTVSVAYSFHHQGVRRDSVHSTPVVVFIRTNFFIRTNRRTP